MIIGRMAVGVIIFALSIGSYIAVEKTLSSNFDIGFGVLMILVMGILFTSMALYILIQRGLI